jgi:hypothetical protein
MFLSTACAALAWASPCGAQETAARDMPATVATTVQDQVADQSPVVGPAPEALSDDELVELRGGEALVITNQTLVAITTGNVINGDYVAGDVSLSDFSLSNFNGLGNVLINTGAQVSLQTGMNVTINVGD